MLLCGFCDTTDAAGYVTTYDYDARGQLLAVTDALQQTTKFTYDVLGNVASVTDPLNHTTTYTYDANGNKKTETRTVTTSKGVRELVTTWSYDAEGRVLTITDAENYTTTYEYDKLGRQRAVKDALNRRTEYVYNDKGELIETIYPDSTPNTKDDNPRTKTKYDAAGRQIETIDQLGRVTKYVYDKVGRLIETIYPDLTPQTDNDNPRTLTEYYTDGLVKAQFDEYGNSTEYRYDGAGRQTEIIYADDTPTTLADNPRTTFNYDSAGQQLSQTDALNHITTYIYDDLGRLTKTEFHDKTVTKITYDAVGRQTVMTDQAGRTTEYRYDVLGRLTGVKDARNQWTEYRYDELGRLIEVEDASDHKTRYEYDGVGRRTAMVLPIGQRSVMTYDAVGNLKTVKDFNSKTTTYRYDEQNRLIEKDFENDPTVTMTYTLTGQVATITDGRGITTLRYDERDRLISRTDPTGPYIPGSDATIEYGYDAASNLTFIKTASGQTTYTYDERNRLKTVSDAAIGLIAYFYDAVGNLRRTEFANGVIENREYDDLNRLKFLKNAKVNATTGQEKILTSYQYTLDSVGNRKRVIDHTGRKVEYDYDELYRLKQEKITESSTVRTIDYVYDNVGNRLSWVDSVEGTTTYVYDDNDRLTNETHNSVVTIYSYDNNGNTISKLTSNQQTIYTWNDENRLMAVQMPNGTVLGYTYDTDGIRVSSTVNGVTTQYLVDKNRDYAQVLEDRTGSNLNVRYIYGQDLISQVRGINNSFYLVDGLGSTTALMDAQGNVTDTYTYEAFGNLLSSTGDTDNRYRFAGEQFDKELGDYYLRQRYYNSGVGRFSQRDTYEGHIFEPISLHKYLYTHANPVNLVDPSGNTPQTDGDIVHSKIGLHFIRGAGITETNNPMQGGIFTRERVYDPRTPYTTGNRPSLGRVIKTAMGNSKHPGVPKGTIGTGGKKLNNGSIYPDLVDFTNHEVYEIKPADNQQQIASGIAELNDTVNILHGLGLNNWHLGIDYTPPSIIPLPWIKENWGMNVVYPDSLNNATHGKFAVVWNLQPGMIVYRTNDPRLDLWVFGFGVATAAALSAWLAYEIVQASARSALGGGAAAFLV